MLIKIIKGQTNNIYQLPGQKTTSTTQSRKQKNILSKNCYGADGYLLQRLVGYYTSRLKRKVTLEDLIKQTLTPMTKLLYLDFMERAKGSITVDLRMDSVTSIRLNKIKWKSSLFQQVMTALCSAPVVAVLHRKWILKNRLKHRQYETMDSLK